MIMSFTAVHVNTECGMLFLDPGTKNYCLLLLKMDLDYICHLLEDTTLYHYYKKWFEFKSNSNPSTHPLLIFREKISKQAKASDQLNI